MVTVNNRTSCAYAFWATNQKRSVQKLMSIHPKTAARMENRTKKKAKQIKATAMLLCYRQMQKKH